MSLRFISKQETPQGGWSYTEASTGITLRALQFSQLIGMVAAHRQANGLDLGDGWAKRMEAEMCMTNPSPCHDPDSVVEDPLSAYGRQLWGELHEYALDYPASPDELDVREAQRWLSAWEERIPKFQKCNCRENWEKFRGIPDLASRRAFYTWTVLAHGRVSEKLGNKPDVVAEFLKIAEGL